MKKLCGIRPTGKLHLGHYFSVIKPALEQGCEVLIARYHAPNSDYRETIDALERFGIKGRLQELNPQLYFNLLLDTPIGELNRMTQYKSAKKKNAHLFVYPVLMAHDLVGYDEVYVGEDQRQHIEFARTLLGKAGLVYPEAKIVGGRIMDLKDPKKKMSKSEPETCLFLSDKPEVIRKKIMGACTNPAGIRNLSVLYREFVRGEYDSKNNKESKEKLSEAIIKKLNEHLR